ncbi:MAG: hypothetical protein WBD32_12860 [Acidobacteriaceae bacterium]
MPTLYNRIANQHRCSALLFGTKWSVAFILAVQLNYAAAPRLPGKRQAESAGDAE